jgi:hypothetical protein
MSYGYLSIQLILIVCLSFAFASEQAPEAFDLSGIPSPPTSFVEQQILEMVSGHKHGDLADAARIQQKLARYYRDKQDLRRSEVAEARAQAASSPTAEREAATVTSASASPRSGGEATAPKSVHVSPAPSSSLTPQKTATPGESGFSGRYFGYEGRTLHTWDFNPDGTFLHTMIAAGVGASARSSERGTFRMSDQHIELTLASSATAFTTPTVGGRGTLVGGGSDTKTEVRRLKIQLQDPAQGIVLDGIPMKVKSW